MAEFLAEMVAQHRYPGEQPWVTPGYDGWNIVNLMASLLAHFELPHGTPLFMHDALAARLAGKRKIVLLLLDGMGWLNLHRAAALQPGIREALDTCWSLPLLSVSPSTTTAALSSVMTGLAPAQHGVLGFIMYFPQYDQVFNMLNFHAPGGQHEDLLTCGFQPETYYGAPTVLERLDRAGILEGAFSYQPYLGSGLSRLLYHQGHQHPYLTIGDLLTLTLGQLASPVRQFEFLYLSNLDTLAHAYGSASPAYALELAVLLETLRKFFLPRLDRETALLVIADHGHIDGDDREVIHLNTLPEVLPWLRAPAAGEGRLMHLFLKPEGKAPVRAALEATGALTILSRDEYLALQLLGPLPLRPGLAESIGDLVLLPHGSRRLTFDYEPRPHTSMIGRHGGLTQEEMVVPLLVWA